MQKNLRDAACLILFILAAAFISKGVAISYTESMPVWLGAGVTFSALIVNERQRWPLLLAASSLALCIWGMAGHHLTPWPALVFAAIEVSSVAFGAWIATLNGRHHDRVSAAALLISGAAIGAAVGGALAVEFWHWQRAGAHALVEWKAWTFSTTLGILLVAPLVTAMRSFKVKRSGGLAMPQFLAGLSTFSLFLFLSMIVFSADVPARFGNLAPTLAYLPMPFLLITAMVWGPFGGALATLLGMMLIVARTASGVGPFALTENFSGEGVIAVQAFVAVWAAILLFMRALSAGRRDALVQQHEWRLRYERMLTATEVASVEYDAVTGVATWGAGAAQTLGKEVFEVRSIDEWLDRIDAAERPLILAAWKAIANNTSISCDHEYSVHLRDGTIVRIRERLAAIHGGDGEVEQIAALLRKITPAGASHV